MNIDLLIAKVHASKPIWDKSRREHSNRNVVDACWRKIAQEMNANETSLRKKWKYLRDQFSVECTKLQIPKLGEDGALVKEPKWCYYKALLFLKDFIKPRAPSDNMLRKYEYHTTGDDVGEESCSNEMYSEELHDNVSDEVVTEEKHLDHTVRVNSTEEVENSYPPPKKMRVQRNSEQYNEGGLLEPQRFQNPQSSFQREQESDDILFFKSLLPFVSKIPNETKLRFRSRIHEVVEEFVFPKTVPGSSTSFLSQNIKFLNDT